MGFSAAGAFMLLFVSAFFAFGTIHAAGANAAEEVRDAQADRSDRAAHLAATDLHIENVTIDEQGCDVNVTINNSGDTTLSVDHTDLVVDGEYETDWGDRSAVEGDGQTDQWHPREQLEADVGELLDAPDRVVVVSRMGVTDVREVSTIAC